MSLTVNNNLLPSAQNSWNSKTKLSIDSAAAPTVTADVADETAGANNPEQDTYTHTFSPAAISLQASVDNLASMLNRIRDKGLTQPPTAILQMQFTEQPHVALLAQANLSAHDVSALLR
jgi:hypothetical protein